MLDISKYAKGLKDEAAMLAEATKLGTDTLTDQSVFRRFGLFCYACGDRAKANKANKMPDGTKIFTAFNTAFRDKSNGFRKELSESSEESWASAFGAFIEAGFWTAWDITPHVEDVLNIEKMSYTSRGAKLRKLMKDHKDTPPTAEEWDKILNPPAKVDTNPLGSLAERWLTSVSDKRVKKNDEAAFNQAAANPAQRIAWIAVRDAIKALIAACEAPAEGTGMTDAEEVAMLKRLQEEKAAAAAAPKPTVN
jgi:hypothetical protein